MLFRTSSCKIIKSSSGFSLVELLTVIAIMAIVMGALVMSLGGQSQGRAVQLAAAQVASGMTLARQYAISKNTDARFIISTQRPTTPGSLLPEDPFQSWAVVYLDPEKKINWVLARDWEKLPAGVVFMNLLHGTGSGYSSLTWQPIGAKLGEPYSPTLSSSTTPGSRWSSFNKLADMAVSLPSKPATKINDLKQIAYIDFDSTGGSSGLGGVGIAEGTINPDNQFILRSTNNVTYVEVDPVLGKTTVRARDSFNK
jgi:prepilin-type N-terminal cleavage/methylation domain-containing protein